MKSIIIIPSRMASKRFPGKPLALINGKTMIERVWQLAMESKIGEVYVAYAEKEIGDLITQIGGKAIMTDPKLESGTDRVYEAYDQIRDLNSVDAIVNLQGDMPLIKPKQISNVLKPLKHGFKVGTLATDLLNNQVNNKNVTKVEIKWETEDVGIANNFFRIKNKINNRIFHHVGIYSYTPETLSKFVNLPRSKNEISLNLEQFRLIDSNINIGVTYAPNIPISVDTKEDLIIAQNIIKDKNE